MVLLLCSVVERFVGYRYPYQGTRRVHQTNHTHVNHVSLIIHKLCINKVPIQQVDNTKFLEVIIDDNLNWSNHISYINSKIAKGIVILCRARKLFSKSALIKL